MNPPTRLVSELRDRSVWQVAGSYAVGAWLVLQLAETLSSLLGLPLWFGSAVVAVLVAGFPIVLVAGSLYTRGRDAPQVPQRFNWRTAGLAAGGLLALLALVTAGYLALRSTGVGPAGTLQAKGLMEPAERLIVTDFTNRSDEPDLGRTVSTLLRIDMAQSPAVSILEPGRLTPVLQRMEVEPGTPLSTELALEVAQREGVKALVDGEVLPLGNGFVITARLRSTNDQGDLVVGRVTARSVDEVPGAVDQLSARLRDRIGESLRSIQGDPPLEEVTTHSLPALQTYANAVQANDAGDYFGAVSLLERALSIDPTFAMAWRKLGIILSNANLDPDRAREAFTRAFEERERLSDRERYLAEAAYNEYVEVDPNAAERVYRDLLVAYPTDATALNNLGLRMQTEGRLEEAHELYRRAVEGRTATPVTYGNALGVAMRLGRVAEGAATAAAFREAFPGNANQLRNQWAFHAAQLHYDEAWQAHREFLHASRGDPIWGAVALFDGSSLAFVRGHLDEGRTMALNGLEVALQAPVAFTNVPPSILEAQVAGQLGLWVLEDPEEAIRWVDAARSSPDWGAQDPTPLIHAPLAQLLADLGRPEGARALLAEVEPGEDGSFESIVYTVAHAAIALAEDRPADALDLLSPHESWWGTCPLCGLFETGRAHELSGNAGGALEAYEGYLAEPLLFRHNADGIYLVEILERTARLKAEGGDRSGAIRALERILELWRDADPALQPRMEAVRQELARLRGVAPA